MHLAIPNFRYCLCVPSQLKQSGNKMDSQLADLPKAEEKLKHLITIDTKVKNSSIKQAVQKHIPDFSIP